jgi:hypothetical protein
LADAKVGILWDEEDSWPGPASLRVDGLTYDQISTESPRDARRRLQWLGLQDPRYFSTQPYEQLAKVLGEAGDSAGQTQILMAMEDARRQYGKLTWVSWLWSWVLKMTIGYGYDPFRALWWIICFVGLGTLLFRRGRNAGSITEAGKDEPQHHLPFNSFIYSLETFLPLVELHQAKYWLPDPTRKYGKGLRIYRWIHILAGWFFTSMLIAGISGLVHKS